MWDAIGTTECSILHVCDYQGSYDDLSPFLDYPGHIVNCSLEVGERTLVPVEAATLFKRPFMGGLQRKGVLATGGKTDIEAAAEAVLEQAPEQFVLAADCTVPAETSWSNLRTAVDVAHSR